MYFISAFDHYETFYCFCLYTAWGRSYNHFEDVYQQTKLSFGGADTEIQKQYEKHIWFKNDSLLTYTSGKNGSSEWCIFIPDGCMVILTGIFVVVYTTKRIFWKYKKRIWCVNCVYSNIIILKIII